MSRPHCLLRGAQLVHFVEALLHDAHLIGRVLARQRQRLVGRCPSAMSELVLARQQHGHALVVDRRHQRVGRRGEERVDLQFDVRARASSLAQCTDARCRGRRMPAAGRRRLIANQCHVAGFTSPLGSQNDVAGTRQRRSSNDPRQNLLLRMVSSRTLVTRLGARPSCSSTKPQVISTKSRSPSSRWRTTGATWPGKIAGQRLIGLGTVVRDAEQSSDHVPPLVQGVEVAHRAQPLPPGTFPHGQRSPS